MYDGGGLFRRGSIYYVMLNFDCCFCQWGSDALVFVAPSPLGPWSPQSAAALAAISAGAAESGLAAGAGTLNATRAIDVGVEVGDAAWSSSRGAAVPPANWSNEVNFCADGQQPPPHVPDMTINPCSQDKVAGVNFTIPAQQFGVAVLANSSGGDAAILYAAQLFSQ